MAEKISKVAMIGVDAADLDFIKTNLHHLPNFKRAFETGVTRKLLSTADVLTGSVWPTFYSGKMPGEHGIYHHLQWDGARMQLRRVTEDWLYSEPFWYELGRRGLRTVVIDVPMTFPLRKQGGTEVITWGSHDELTPFATQPPQLAYEIRSRFGKHPMGHEIPVRHSRGELDRIRRKLIEGARRKGELALWLSGDRDWDFFLTVFGECHRGGHLLWPGPLTAMHLLDVYRAVDREVGRLLEVLTPCADVYIFSLHGMTANTSQEHFVPQILEVANRHLLGDKQTVQPAARKSRLVPWLRAHVPARLQNTVAQTVPVSVRDWVVNHSVVDGYNWDNTVGFPILADLNAYVRLNVAGREREGIIEPNSSRVSSYCTLLEECFRSFRLPSGRSLVREVVFSGKEFPGVRSHNLPDIIVTWTPEPPATEIHSEQFGTLTAEIGTGRGGNHQPHGFCIELSAEQNSAEQDRMHISELAAFSCRKWYEGFAA